MPAKSNTRAIALVAVLLAPCICFAQSGTGIGTGAGGPAGSNTAPASTAPGSGAAAGSDSNGVPPVRNNPAPSAGTGTIPPAVNDNLTWDSGRQRPNNTRQAYRIYPRPKSALTSFEVRPFDGFAKECYFADRGSMNPVGRRSYICE